MTSIATVLSSIIQVAGTLGEMTALYQRINSGGEVTDAEWHDLRTRLEDANDDWASAG